MVNFKRCDICGKEIDLKKDKQYLLRVTSLNQNGPETHENYDFCEECYKKLEFYIKKNKTV